MYLYCDFSQKKSKYQTLCLTDTTIQQNSYTADKLYRTDEETNHPDEGTRHLDARTSHPELKKSHPCKETSLPVDGIYVRGASTSLNANGIIKKK